MSVGAGEAREQIMGRTGKRHKFKDGRCEDCNEHFTPWASRFGVCSGDQRAGKQASAEPTERIRDYGSLGKVVPVPSPRPVSALRERKALLWLKENIGPSMDYTRAVKIIEDALRPERPDA